MSRWIRALVTITIALAGSVVALTPAMAAPAPMTTIDLTACEQEALGYSPDSPCQLVVESAAQCLRDVPYLAYAATVEGAVASTLSLTFLNQTGPDVVLTDQPLTGKVPWPGAEFDADGNATDWPGWTQLDSGEWVFGDEYSWTRPEVTVRFEVNPDATVTVSYPPPTAVCYDPIVTESGVVVAGNEVDTGVDAESGVAVAGAVSTPVLSATGASVTPLLAVAGGLVGVGLIVLLVTRRRRTAQH